jgi:uncharacterized protein (DUF1778 family)
MARSPSRVFRLKVSRETADLLEHAAAVRGTSPSVVAARIVRTLVGDDLISAVLDDADAVATEQRWQELEG